MEKEIYYIWEDGLTHDFCGMLKKEYDRIIWNSHKIMKFERASGFESLDDVLAYVKAYFKNIEPQIIER